MVSKSTIPIPKTTAVYGITDEKVANEPTQ
jgi:hypothetical protein